MLPNYIKQTVTITILQSKLQHEKKGLNVILLFNERVR